MWGEFHWCCEHEAARQNTRNMFAGTGAELWYKLRVAWYCWYVARRLIKDKCMLNCPVDYKHFPIDTHTHTHASTLSQQKPNKPSSIIALSSLPSYHSTGSTLSCCDHYPLCFSFLMEWQHPVGQGLFIVEISGSHADTPHSVGLLCTGDQPVAATYARNRTPFPTDRYPHPRRDSNPQSQQVDGRRPTP